MEFSPIVNVEFIAITQLHKKLFNTLESINLEPLNQHTFQKFCLGFTKRLISHVHYYFRYWQPATNL